MRDVQDLHFDGEVVWAASSGGVEAFDLDGGLLVADAKWRAYGPLFVYARYSREWHLKKEGNDKGHYETINDYDIGVGAQFTF